MVLMLYTGQRRSDAIKMGWKDVDGDMIRIRQQKTAAKLAIPTHEDLREHLDATDRDASAFLMNAHGWPFTPARIGARMRKDRAGLPDCTSHGLRNACTTRLAEAGKPDREIMAVTGHTDLSQVSVYVRAANQKRLAVRAMNRIGGTADPTPGPAHMAFGFRGASPEASLAGKTDDMAGRTRTPNPTPGVAGPEVAPGASRCVLASLPEPVPGVAVPGETARGVAVPDAGGGRPGGTRTPNQSVMSALL